MTASTTLRAQLLALTTRLREKTGDERACALMHIDPTIDEPYEVWLHADGISEAGRATSFSAPNEAHAIDVADRRLLIDSVHTALSWEHEVRWLSDSWEHPGGIPYGARLAASAKQDAARWWISDHPDEVAAEREARAAALRAMLAGADEAFRTQRMKTA